MSDGPNPVDLLKMVLGDKGPVGGSVLSDPLRLYRLADGALGGVLEIVARAYDNAPDVTQDVLTSDDGGFDKLSKLSKVAAGRSIADGEPVDVDIENSSDNDEGV